MCFGGDGGASKVARQTRALEDERQARINAGVAAINDTFGRFNDDFYAQRAAAYRDYALPQLGEQYDKARRDLIFALSNSGLLNSSVAATRLADLDRDYARRRMEIADEAERYANEARSSVEQARSGLLQQLYSTGDAATAGNAAIQQARMLSVDPSFSPLAQVFQNVTAGLAAGRQASDDATWMEQRRQRSAALFGSSPQGSGRVVN